MNYQMTTLRLPNGTTVSFTDWQDKPIYSTLDLLDGYTDQELDAFTYVVGDQVASSSNAVTTRTASELDTNVQSPGSMANTEEMLVYAIRPHFYQFVLDTPFDPTTVNLAAAGATGTPTPRQNAIAIIQSQSVLRLRVSQKIEQGAGLEYFNGGMGVYTQQRYDAAALAAGRTVASAGMPTQEAVRSYVIPVHIGGLEKYRVTLENPTGNGIDFGLDEAATPADATPGDSYMRLKLYLDGLYKRPVA